MSLLRSFGARIWKVFITVFAVFRRAVCCGRRRRRLSDTPLPVTATSLGTVSVVSNEHKDEDLQAWNSWNDGEEPPAGIIIMGGQGDALPEHTYNGSVQRDGRESESQPEEDFFRDMVPQIRKPKMVVVRRLEDSIQTQNMFSHRLAVDTTPVNQGIELGAWEDQSGTWEQEAESEATWDTGSVLREQKRREREMRAVEHHKKKLEREALRTNKKEYLGVKIK